MPFLGAQFSLGRAGRSAFLFPSLLVTWKNQVPCPCQKEYVYMVIFIIMLSKYEGQHIVENY